MKSPIQRIVLSNTAKEQLIKLKRQTKIENWNILCRWAFCKSLAESTSPAVSDIPADSNVEMSWSVFGGEIADLLLIALKQRCQNEGLVMNEETLKQQFRLHLHRGISYLTGDNSIK
ncbi:MAG: DNA sulfur modification protein DndE, partial [Cyanobacteria bacterium J083]